MKTTPRRVFALMLALILLLSLCACAQKQQTEMNAQNVNEAESTSKNGEQMSKEDTEDSTLERPRNDRKSHDEDAQEESPQNTGAAAFPSKVDKRTPETQPEEPAAQSAMKDQDIYEEEPASQPMQYGLSAEGEATLGWLRDRIDFPMTMFGAAYLGYVGGLFDEGFEEGFPAWLWETNEAMLLKYPFIAEIDEVHIIGDNPSARNVQQDGRCQSGCYHRYQPFQL